jgi:hypothetical protein
MERRAALARPIGEAVNAAGLRVNRATVLPPETTVEDAIKASDGWPVLVARSEGTVVGIATPFDLL